MRRNRDATWLFAGKEKIIHLPAFKRTIFLKKIIANLKNKS